MLWIASSSTDAQGEWRVESRMRCGEQISKSNAA
jgi:hypothetical protein